MVGSIDALMANMVSSCGQKVKICSRIEMSTLHHESDVDFTETESRSIARLECSDAIPAHCNFRFSGFKQFSCLSLPNTSGPLDLLFPLPGPSSSDIYIAFSFTESEFLLKCLLTYESFSGHSTSILFLSPSACTGGKAKEERNEDRKKGNSVKDGARQT
ncbi:hypothetical protein AAY473_021105 [Plecturocebus cupreus]